MELHNREQVEHLIHLAKSDESFLSFKELKQLKSTLIITADSGEPSHFMKTIREKLCSFVRAPIYLEQQISLLDPNVSIPWLETVSEKDLIFKAVDLIAQTDLCSCRPGVIKSLLRNYDLLVFTLYAGTGTRMWDQETLSIFHQLIDSNQIAVLFLRGSEQAMPFKLGYSLGRTDGFIEFITGDIALKVDKIKQINQKSLEVLINRQKMNLKDNIQESSPTETILTPNCIYLSDTYMCGVVVTTLTRKDDWHFLAESSDYQGKDRVSWLVHKNNKVMFTPWYGFSHGNNSQYDITFYSLKFLLFEYLRKSGETFVSNLALKQINNQLSDMEIIF
ncbi:predicted protein [Naegleria gruberi]|uniref:Predicted protein n=1 Tax=Naegleria gruberi TaxID=5762 RepID=D2VQ83_NAEGR|nr:uncharacterized protein NAEGRDRAFT_71058 [Naegleria gruberi]EFC41063.1 predicted protein [Naegleria gruberi]|eukprot:XP_002673807.1 predicted protein [Naegleria gruberi strain NEG-M]